MSIPQWFLRLPWGIVACSAALMALGLTAIDRGDALSQAGTFLGRQALWGAVSLPAMLLMTLFPYRGLRHVAAPLFGLSLALLVAVYFFPPRSGAQRWIPLGFMYLQPSEVAKLAFIFALAHYLMFRSNFRSLAGLAPPFVLTVVPMGLILKEPDLGTSLVFVPILFAMLFAAGARARHLLMVSVAGAALAPVLWMGMSAEQRSRVTAVFTQRDGGSAPKGDGYHLHQSKQVLALGGVWGSEFGEMPLEDRAAYHLPACRTDFVFCMVGERWGLFGGLAAFALYVLLFAQGLKVAAQTREPFGRLLAVGVVALLATQVVINTGMTVGLMPVTGITLPLLSYGGSSLLTTCIALGLLLNVGMRPGYEMAAEPFRWTE